MLNQILVPLDGSALSECVLPHAEALARSFDATVTLLRVIAPDPGAPAATLGGAGGRLAKAEAASYLTRISERLSANGIGVTTTVEEGPVAQRIVEAARHNKADLVILSSGRGTSVSVEVGRNARDVIAASPTSVMSVRPTPTGAGDGGTYQRIVVPVDGSKRAEWAMCLAASIARQEGAELLLLYVVVPPDILDGDGRDAAGYLRGRVRMHNSRVASQYLRRLTERLSSPDLEVSHALVENANVARAIDRVSREFGADLVVVSAHGQSGHVGWSYGSKARRLLDEGANTTLVLQDAAPQPRQARTPREVPRRRAAPARIRT